MYQLFSYEQIAEFAHEQAAVIRRYSDRPVTHNSSMAFSLDNESLFGGLDFASYDTYAGFHNIPAYLLNCDLFRNIKPGRSFWIMETSPSHASSLESTGTPHPDGYLKAEAAAAYALGAEGFCYWLWRQQRAGCEMTHGSILSTWGQPTVGYRNVLEAEEARKALEPILLATRPAQAEAAITYSDRSKAFLRTETHRKLNHRGLVTGFYDKLLSLGIHRDLIPEGAEPDGYKLLFTPFLPYLSPDYLDQAIRFAENGGIWVVGPLSGGRTESHTFHTDAALGARLEHAAGVETVFTYPMDGTGGIGHAFGVSAPLSLWSSLFRPLPGTDAVGIVESGLSPGLAFMTDRQVGCRGGRIVMLGSMPAGDEGDALLMKLADHYAHAAGVSLRWDGTPGTIVAPRMDAAGRRVWIAVNMNGTRGSVTLPCGGIDLLSGGTVSAGQLAVEPFGFRIVRLED